MAQHHLLIVAIEAGKKVSVIAKAETKITPRLLKKVVEEGVASLLADEDNLFTSLLS